MDCGLDFGASGIEASRSAAAATSSAVRFDKPHLLLLDDLTTGLDPITATTLDDQIVKQRDLEHVTSIAVTHQIRDAVYVAEHDAFRAGGRVQIVPAASSAAERVTF